VTVENVAILAHEALIALQKAVTAPTLHADEDRDLRLIKTSASRLAVHLLPRFANAGPCHLKRCPFEAVLRLVR
jgi:hypothetical protein